MSQGRVLVVEDDPSIRQLTRLVLEARGYEIAEAADGPSALPAARAAHPDVILLDIGLPGLDGFGVLSQLKEDAALCDVPVMMVTAWAEPELVAKALDRGAHDYIRKPFDIADLGARVDAAACGKARPDALADPLTRLPNRLQLTDDLSRHIAMVRRSGLPLSVVCFDLDRFQSVNEQYGKTAGDGVLRAVGRRLSQRIRRADVIGRWGDEEFVVIAPDTALGGAGTLAEDLRVTLMERPLDVPQAALRVTASFGVAEWTGEDPDELLARAGAALRDAKEGGRNAVRLAQPAPVAA